MVKNFDACRLLLKCGEDLQLNDDVLEDLKPYVIRYVYGDVQSSSLDLARAAKWKGQKKSLHDAPAFWWR